MNVLKDDLISSRKHGENWSQNFKKFHTLFYSQNMFTLN